MNLTKEQYNEFDFTDKQAIFNHVVEHAIEQNQRATDTFDKRCYYRTTNGLSCFVGCLIPDELYVVDYENCDAISLVESDLPLIKKLRDADKYFLRDLQIVHDDYHVDLWRRKLIGIATERNLDIPIVLLSEVR